MTRHPYPPARSSPAIASSPSPAGAAWASSTARRSSRSERPVALKLIAPELRRTTRASASASSASRRLAASIDHPNVIPVYEAGEADGALYLAMRYVDGTDLRRADRARGRARRRSARCASSPRSPRRSTPRTRAASSTATSSRPTSCSPAEDEHVYLTDFGLTKRTPSAARADARPGSSSGTLDYCAPEQIRGEPVDGRADVYALGCVLFQLPDRASRPFERDTDVAKMYAHLNDRSRRVTAPAPARPGGARRRSSRKALAKEPDERYATAGELAPRRADAALDAARTPLAPGARAPRRPGRAAPSAPPRRRRPPAPRRGRPHRGARPRSRRGAAALGAAPPHGARRHARHRLRAALARPRVLGRRRPGRRRRRPPRRPPRPRGAAGRDAAAATPAADAPGARRPAAERGRDVKVGKGPDGIAVDETGVVWVTNHRTRHADRIDGETDKRRSASRSRPATTPTASSPARASSGSRRPARAASSASRPPASRCPARRQRRRPARGHRARQAARVGRQHPRRQRQPASTARRRAVVGAPIGVGSKPTGIFVGSRACGWPTPATTPSPASIPRRPRSWASRSRSATARAA